MTKLTGLISKKWLVALAAGVLLTGSVACGESVNGKGTIESGAVRGADSAAQAPAPQDQGAALDPAATPTPITKGIPNTNPQLLPPAPTPTPSIATSPSAPTLPVAPLSVPPGPIDPASLPALAYQALMNGGAIPVPNLAPASDAPGLPIDPASLTAQMPVANGKSPVVAIAPAGPAVAGQLIDEASVPGILAQSTKGGGAPRQAPQAGTAAPSQDQVRSLAAVGAAPAASAVSDCATYSSQKVRDWCGAPNPAVLLTCADFALGTGEATRFTQMHDADDTNGLDKDGDGRSCTDR